MKYLKAWAVLSVMAALGGCGSKIQSGQLDYDNGVAYKHGSNDPYTGTVHFNEVPPFVLRTFSSLPDRATGPLFDHHIVQPENCDIDFKNGVVEGRVRCQGRSDDRSISFSIHQQQMDGEEVVYHQGGDKAFEYYWTDGQLHGLQKIYSVDSKYVMHEWHEKGGYKVGEEIRRRADGSRLSKGEWGDDGKFTGTVYVSGESAVYTLEDGVKDGEYFQTDPGDEKKHLVDGEYKDGQQKGTWTYRGSVAIDSIIGSLPVSSYGDGFRPMMTLAKGQIIDLTWKDGVLSGPIKIYDKSNNVIESFTFENGEVKAPIERFDPASDKKFDIEDASVIEAVNYVGNRGSTLENIIQQWAFSHHVSMQQASAAISKEEDEKQARINYVVDPMHNPLPSVDSGSTPPAVPSASPTSASPFQPSTSMAPAPSPAVVGQLGAALHSSTESSLTRSVLTAQPRVHKSDAALDGCVTAWVTAYRKEAGQDVIVTQDQLDEWQQWCSQGKRPT